MDRTQSNSSQRKINMVNIFENLSWCRRENKVVPSYCLEHGYKNTHIFHYETQ